jgi:hypothetical protein
MECVGSWGSSVSNSVWLQTWFQEEGGSIPAEAKHFFSSLCVQASSEAHPASYPMRTGVLSTGVKRGRSAKLTTHLLASAKVKNE